MDTLRDLRLQAGLSVNRLAHISGVDRKTVERAEEGLPVQDVKAYAIVRALAQALQRQITLDDVEGLQLVS